MFNLLWDKLENLEDEEDEEAANAAAWLASLITGILATREAQNEQRREHRLYLHRGELLFDPIFVPVVYCIISRVVHYRKQETGKKALRVGGQENQLNGALVRPLLIQFNHLQKRTFFNSRTSKPGSGTLAEL